MNNIKNILIVGRTGSGKSTLANVLCDICGSDTTKFKESNYSIRRTKDFNFPAENFTYNGMGYCVVDTPGIGSINIANDEILEIVEKLSEKMPEGISQVLFVIDERFTAEEMQVFEFFGKKMFDS